MFSSFDLRYHSPVIVHYSQRYLVFLGAMEQALQSRDDFVFQDDTGFRNAVIIKYSIIAAIFFAFFAWFVGGYFHARRRIKKGLPPLAYHRVGKPRRKVDGSLKLCSFSYHSI